MDADRPYLAASQTLAFLRRWFAHCPTGAFVEVRPLNKRPGQKPLGQAWFDKLDEAFDYVSASFAHGDDVYIGALPRSERAGTVDAVRSHGWLWGDIDYGSLGHAKPSPYATRADAISAISAVAPPPTMVIDTGGGFHAWWAVRDASGAPPSDAAVWRDAITRLAGALRADANALDAPRILRVAGTANFKTPPGRSVQLVECREDVYALDSFLALPLPTAPTKRGRARRASAESPFARANAVPIHDVLAWLSVTTHQEGERTYCACPVHGGTNTSQMIVGGLTNSAHCFGDCGRSFTCVDLVAGARRVAPAAAVDLMADRFGFAGLAAVRRLADADGGADDWLELLDWVRDEKGGRAGLYPGVKNTSLILLNDPEWKGLLAYDEFLQSVIARREPPCLDWAKPTTLRRAGRFTEDDYARGRLWLSDKYRFTVGKECIYESIAKIVSKTQAFHPVRAYLATLEGKWDGTPRIETFPKVYLGAAGEPVLEASFTRWFLLSAIARVCEPGCKADSTIILEGPQGLGKSTAIRILGGEWVADSPIQIGTKDAFIALCGVWIAELAELESLLRSDPDAVKAFLSSPVDRYRPPYAREAEDFPRQCVFAGTVNHFEYLKDPTGARRFWPVRCTAIDLERLRHDRDQIWAEALMLYRAGHKWWPTTPEEIAACERAQESRFQVDAWEAQIREYLLRIPAQAEQDGVRVDEILSKALYVPTKDHDRGRQARVVSVLERFGFKPGRPRRDDGSRPRAYLPADGWAKAAGA